MQNANEQSKPHYEFNTRLRYRIKIKGISDMGIRFLKWHERITKCNEEGIPYSQLHRWWEKENNHE